MAKVTREAILRKDTLRSLRVKHGYTQEEAAKLLGISITLLRKWEHDASKIPLNWAEKIAEFYGTPMHRIFFGPESTFCELARRVAASGPTDHDSR